LYGDDHRSERSLPGSLSVPHFTALREVLHTHCVDDAKLLSSCYVTTMDSDQNINYKLKVSTSICIFCYFLFWFLLIYLFIVITICCQSVTVLFVCFLTVSTFTQLLNHLITDFDVQ